MTPDNGVVLAETDNNLSKVVEDIDVDTNGAWVIVCVAVEGEVLLKFTEDVCDVPKGVFE